MITNNTELKAAVAAWLDRADLTATIPDFIRLAEADFISRIHTREMEKSTTAVTVAGTETVALPSGYTGIRDVYVSGDPKRVLNCVALDYLRSRYASSTGGTPEMYAISGDNFILAPTPNDVFTLNIYYYGLDPIETSSTNWLLTVNPDIYLAGALTQAYKYIKNEERAGYWARELDFSIALLEQRDRVERYGTDLRTRPAGMNIV